MTLADPMILRIAFSPVKILLLRSPGPLGYSRFALFVIGVFVGLALAPTTGAEFRAKLRELIQGEDQPPVVPV